MEGFDEDYNEQRRMIFDFKGFLFKVLHLWPWIVLSIATAFVIAYFINDRKQNVYKLDTLISVESDQNPFFTSNTSISFNWGGVSGKVGKIMTAIRTRSHNEMVVDSLSFYMQYLEQGKYRMEDRYKSVPFEVILNKTEFQALDLPIGIHVLNTSEFELFINLKEPSVIVQNYVDKQRQTIAVNTGAFKKICRFGQPVQTSFFNGVIRQRDGQVLNLNTQFFIRFSDFDKVVNTYQNAIAIQPFSKESPSVLKLSLEGNNKTKIVDYLNATASILSSGELERKNQYATNTIRFIDSSLSVVQTELKGVTDELSSFRKKNKVFDADEEVLSVAAKLKALDVQKDAQQTKLNYLNALEHYVRTKTDYTKIAAPTSVGIEDQNILKSVSKITGLAIERQNLAYTVKEGNVLFKDLDRQLDTEKKVLLETISATGATFRSQLATLNGMISKLESQLNSLPEDQQQYLKIQRKINMSQEAYDLYMAKRGEAAIVRAANVSDIVVIDEAKDIGEGLIGPNRALNYMMALMLGFLTPLILIFVRILFDDTIYGVDEVAGLSTIPIIGLIGKYTSKDNFIVYEEPKSAVAEAFRSIRSSLQFLLKNQDETEGGKVIMITSSISGEGKTAISINMATVYALSGKKTILLGLDLRKPKIYKDFGIANENGIANYLNGETSLEPIIQHSHILGLDVIPSGPRPPNPSELLVRKEMSLLIQHLKLTYDIIILDTPPLALVTDAMDLAVFADITLFVLRLDYTKKGMLELINAKHKIGEVKNISFVLNFYKHKANNNYGYGYGYAYGDYGKDYHDKDQSESLKKRILRRFKGA